jgi:hypothetical protein
LLNAISRNLPSGGWIMANIDGSYPTAGAGGNGQSNVDPVIPKVQAYYEEKDIRALIANNAGFLGVYNQVYYRNTYDSPSYAVLDSGTVNSDDPNLRKAAEEDDQDQLTTLAAYYLLAPTNPSQGALDFYGGEGTTTPWVQPNTSPPAYNHWSPAATYNVGTPVSALPQTPDDFLGQGVSGTDPDGSTYYVYDRHFTGQNGQSVLVLYKPISSSGAMGSGTATTITLNGSYYVLQADGTLSSTPQTTISLENGQGAILVQAGTDAPQIAGATK